MKKIVKFVIPLTILALPVAVYPEVGVLEVDHYCGFKREQSTRKRFTTFEADQDAMRVIKRITRYVGMMNPRFDVKGADISTGAAAVIRNNKRYILYNPYFITKVVESTGSSWAEVSVLAHEIGHHVNWHTLIKDGSRPNKELEADHFAGYILQRMGASIDDAVTAMESLTDEQASDTHPARFSRVAAIASGWREARGQRQSTQPVVIPAPVAPQVPEPEMVSIRGGTFMMGSPTSEKGRDGDEKRHSVTVGNFSMGKYEISNAEYARCVSAGACKPPEWQESGSKYNLKTGSNKIYQGLTDQQQPVVGVSWNNAMSYARWLSEATGRNYSLPTEAQWEYAARAGSNTAYPWGNAIASNKANCNGCGSHWGGKTTAPVKSFSANAWGLHNTVGNVWEWVCSAYDENYAGSEQRCAANGDKRSRVLRGGSWVNAPGDVRSAGRSWSTAADRIDSIGFRLFRTP